MCGGTSPPAPSACHQPGLSPRVRGNRHRRRQRMHWLRSIPACAGEPYAESYCAIWRKVYPRVCGGTANKAGVPVDPKGLSPRVRGNRPDHIQAVAALGSIPACAGEPSEVAVKIRVVGVYPRVCGGTQLRRPLLRAESGLSPRVRGNPLLVAFPAGLVRSIPACAGEPRLNVIWTRLVKVYPRVCGGTQAIQRAGYYIQGLSPRVRGNHTAP